MSRTDSSGVLLRRARRLSTPRACAGTRQQRKSALACTRRVLAGFSSLRALATAARAARPRKARDAPSRRPWGKTRRTAPEHTLFHPYPHDHHYAGGARLDTQCGECATPDAALRVCSRYNAFWGENVQGARAHPVAITAADGRPVTDKVVYSPHSYGPGVYRQLYFRTEDFAAHMPTVWDTQYGYLAAENAAPVVVGEWGGKGLGDDGTWQTTFRDYLTARKIGSFYWCLNPDSGDTGGLIKQWQLPLSLETAKLEMLASLPGSHVPTTAERRWRGPRSSAAPAPPEVESPAPSHPPPPPPLPPPPPTPSPTPPSLAPSLPDRGSRSSRPHHGKHHDSERALPVAAAGPPSLEAAKPSAGFAFGLLLLATLALFGVARRRALGGQGAGRLALPPTDGTEQAEQGAEHAEQGERSSEAVSAPPAGAAMQQEHELQPRRGCKSLKQKPRQRPAQQTSARAVAPQTNEDNDSDESSVLIVERGSRRTALRASLQQEPAMGAHGSTRGASGHRPQRGESRSTASHATGPIAGGGVAQLDWD